MSEKNDRAPGGPGGSRVAPKTVVGVPALSTERPSDLELTRELPPKVHGDDTGELPTMHAVKAVSMEEAARMLPADETAQSVAPAPRESSPASPRPPHVVGAVSRPLPRVPVPTKRPPVSMSERPSATAQVPRMSGSEARTNPGVAPQPGLSPKGRTTLLLDSSAPPAVVSDGSSEGPPIVVPTGASPMPPKAVTQAPPWGEAAGRATLAIPKSLPPPRDPEPSIEEISGSLLLADASTQVTASKVEELSGSLLLPDASGNVPAQVEELSGSLLLEEPADASKGPAANLSRPPGRTTFKPPVPTSSKPPPAAHRTLLGMPELPPATPPPRLDFPPQAVAPAAPEPMAAMNAVPSVVLSPSVAPPPAVPSFAPQAPSALPVPESASGTMTGDIELTRLPRSGLQSLLDSIRGVFARARATMPTGSALGPGRRPVWFLPVVAVGGLVVGTGVVGLLLAVVRGGSERGPAPRAASSSLATATTTAPAITTAAPTVEPALTPVPTPATIAPPSLSACTMSGTPHVIAPGATVSAGVEAVRLGDTLALGFAPSEHDAMVVRVDPSSLTASATAKARAKGAVRRVLPALDSRGALSLLVDSDRKGDRLQGRRTVPAASPFQLGASAGHLSWAHTGGAPAGDLWPLEEGGRVESLRGSTDAFGDGTMALAFRRGAAVLIGALSGASPPAPTGNLARVDGLGNAVGSPTVAIDAGVIMVAWSDRASSDDPWRLRWVVFRAGDAPGTPFSFTPPIGGKGDQAMSPSVTALPGSRFLLLWTEGPASDHDLRGLTLTSEGKPLGAPLALSADGINAGQGQAAVNASGDGVVAFLESAGSGFQVAATSIRCAP